MTDAPGDIATGAQVPAPLTGAPAPLTDEDLDEYLSRPTASAVATMASLGGDVLVLGAGGKMGHSLSRMAVRASSAAGVAGRRVTAVSRFASRESRDAFERDGIATIAADLLEPGVLDGLPDAPNVLYLAGMKFGSTGDEPSTWAMNAFLPGLVARRFAASRIVALSTANVYPFTRPDAGGAREGDPVGPVGEYAQSCLGRERILEWHARRNGTPVALIRLAYANALTYGVLVDIAQGVAGGGPIDLAMGFANVIWQGDANAAILGAFGLARQPGVGVEPVRGRGRVGARDRTPDGVPARRRRADIQRHGSRDGAADRQQQGASPVRRPDGPTGPARRVDGSVAARGRPPSRQTDALPGPRRPVLRGQPAHPSSEAPGIAFEAGTTRSGRLSPIQPHGAGGGLPASIAPRERRGRAPIRRRRGPHRVV